jgi:hypothetical protein
MNPQKADKKIKLDEGKGREKQNKMLKATVLIVDAIDASPP